MEKTNTERLKILCKDAANELCLKCGVYKQEHLGYCNGCRWQPIRHGDFSGEGITDGSWSDSKEA